MGGTVLNLIAGCNLFLYIRVTLKEFSGTGRRIIGNRHLDF